MNWITVAGALRAKGLQIVTPLELQRLLGVSAVAARFLVHRYAQRGLLIKLRNGLYATADRPPSDAVVANRLYEPSYLSFEWALSYHHVIPETVYVLTSATMRPTRTLAARGTTFEYHRLKPSVFTGYEPVRMGADTVLIATPEKALVDTLYFVDLKRRSPNDRLNLRPLRWRRVDAYARLFARPSLRRLLAAIR